MSIAENKVAKTIAPVIMNVLAHKNDWAKNHVALTDANATCSTGHKNIGSSVIAATNKIVDTYIVSQANTQLGELVNHALLSYTALNELVISEVFSANLDTPALNFPTTTIIIQRPALSAAKVATSAGPYSSIGDVFFSNITMAASKYVVASVVGVRKSHTDCKSLVKISNNKHFTSRIKKA